MEIVTLYVGQGGLAVARNAGEAIFVDSCLPGDDAHRERVIAQLDRTMRNQAAAGLMLTGFDSDHCNPDGVELILSRYKPRWVMYPTYYKDTDCAADSFKIIDKHVARRERTGNPLKRVSVRVDKVQSRALSGLSNAFGFELFSPHIDDMDHSNNSSIVVKLTSGGPGGFSYLITGDTETGRWERISQLFGDALRADVLDAPHHGSNTGMHAGALLNIRPHTVLISCGVDSQYGHPHSQALTAYGRVAERVYCTNINGGVSLFTKRRGADLETEIAA